MVKPMRSRPSFFKIMLADFKSHLRIPPAFMKHVRGRLGAQAELRLAGGKKWRKRWLVQVETKPPNDHTFFTGGWRAFASQNSIHHGDFLVFYYDGASGFTVSSYGPDCSEKKQQSTTTAGSLKRSDSPEAPHSSSYFCPTRHLIDGCEEDNVVEGMEEKMKMMLPKEKGKRQLVHDFLTHSGCCSLTIANPYFALVFSNLYLNRLRIPQWLVREYGLRGKKYVTFKDPRGITWTVKLYHLNDGRAEVSNGWIDFHKGNHLRHGDVCIFELFEGGKLLKVNIISANKQIAEHGKKPEIIFSQDGEGSFPNIKLIEGNCLMNGDAHINDLLAFDGGGHQVGKKSFAIINYKVETLLVDDDVSMEEAIPTTDGGHDHLVGEDGFPNCQEKDICTIKSDEGLQPQLGKSPVDGDVQLKGETSISNCEEHREAFTTFETPYPHFSRTFRSYYYSLNIPKAIVKKLGLKHMQKLVLYDPSGESYSVKLSRRANRSTDLIGWAACAKRNGIASGDTCNFEFLGSGELRVRIVRAGESGNTVL